MKHPSITYHTVSRETFQKTDKLIANHRELLESYLDQLLWWNQRLNLVSRDVPRETIWEHIRHSLLLGSFDIFQENSFIVDTGTGGGLPGMPLAICFPDKRFLLNDIVSKKVLAVRQMSKQLGLRNVETKDQSIAKLAVDEPFLGTTKHAFKIDELYSLTSHLQWQTMIFYKGLNFEEELSDIENSLSVDAYDLFEKTREDFYKGKALVMVSRVNHRDTRDA